MISIIESVRKSFIHAKIYQFQRTNEITNVQIPAIAFFLQKVYGEMPTKSMKSVQNFSWLYHISQVNG